MGRIISAVATKGGAGKSTLILSLAYSKPFREYRCCILDTDNQGSISDWWAARQDSGRKDRKGDPQVDVFHQADETKLKADMERLFNEYDFVFMDSPGESVPGEKTKLAMAYSDIVILPVKTGEFDFLSTINKLLPVLEQAISISDAKFLLLPSMIHISSSQERIVDLFNGTPAECMPTFFPERKVFREFLGDGMTLKEYSRQGSKRAIQQARKAVKEIDDIAAEILKHIKQ